MSAETSIDTIDSSEIDLSLRPWRAQGVVTVETGTGSIAWVAQDRAPIVLDAATRLLLDLFDGESTLAEIVADLEAELGDDGDHDIETGVLMATGRLGMEGLVEGVTPLPAGRAPSLRFRQLTGWADHVREVEAMHARAAEARAARGEPPHDHDHEHDHDDADESELSCGDKRRQLDRATFFSLHFPTSPVRVSTTVPELQDAVEVAAPERLGPEDGPLLWSAVEGDETRVGRSFFTLYGPNSQKLVLTPEARDELVRRSLHHLSLPLWMGDRPDLWWTGLRTLVGPDGAVLMSAERLGSQVGLLRALERAGYRVVDMLFSAVDPATREVLVLPTRLDPDRGELGPDDGTIERVPLAVLALEMFEYLFVPDTRIEFFAKGLAVAVEPGPAVDRAELLEASVAMAAGARRLVLVGETVREVVAALGPPG